MSKLGVTLEDAHAQNIPKATSEDAALEDQSVGVRNDSKPSDPLIGKTLNNSYVVQGLLGQGGMGRVYTASHTRIPEKRYAIKVLRPEMATNQHVLARFQREAEAAARISHPNVVGVYDVDRTEDGLPYLVCEHLEGMELAEFIERAGKVNAVTAIHICHSVCEAVEAAHACGVIHRDLKPQNVFLVGNLERGMPRRPVVKVLDFGISRLRDSDNSLTRSGMIMGTPAFMAPEQARGEQTDHRTDVYGVGAILYTMLTGRAPFSEDEPHVALLAVTREDPPRPRSIDPTIPQHLELAVQRAMAKAPANRFADMGCLKRAIDPFADAVTSPIRRQLNSHDSIENGSTEAKTARPLLLLTILMAVVLVAVVLSMAVVALSTLTGWLSFQPVEVALLMLGALGTSLTPGIVLFSRLRRKVWNNTARVLDTLTNLRAPLVAGILGYGGVVLLVRFSDLVLARFADTHLIGLPAGAAWTGWDLIFPIVGVLAAAVASLQRGALAGNAKPWIPALVYGTTLLVAGGVVLGGFVWRATSPPSTSEAPIAAVPSLRPDSAASNQAVGTGSPDSSAAHVPGKKASAAELSTAIAAGLGALVSLADEFPDDPDVLKPLMFAYASRAKGHVEAMAVGKKLFAIAPERAKDKEIRLLIWTVARTSSTASGRAFELLAEHMGLAGLEVLYDIMIAKDKAEPKARELLAKPDIQKRFSPALAIAYQLERAPTCEARLPLLERASQEGDERSVTILVSLANGKPRGCGKRGRHRCPPACPDEAGKFLSAVADINERARDVP